MVTEELKKLRERAGLSMDRLARDCGFKGASSYQRYENPKRYTKQWLPLPLVAKIAKALTGKGKPPIEQSEVMALAGVKLGREGKLPDTGNEQFIGLIHDTLGQPDIDLEKATNLPENNSLPRDVPVFGVAIGGAEGDFNFNGTVVDYVRRPPSLMKIKNAFGVYVSGDSMSPKFEHGDLVFVHPGRPPQPGNDVIVELYGEHGAPGPCYIKRLVRRSPDRIILAQFNPPRDDIAVDTDRIKAVYRILTTAEMLGV